VGCAGLLLTGGRSTRMGRDKATIRIRSNGEAPGGGSGTLAQRTADLLRDATEMALEVGPGFTELDHVSESPPGNGPLFAVAAGAAELGHRGWHGPVLVVATDLPRLTSGMLAWLAGHAPGRSVVPLAGARPQPLCARYEPVDLALAGRLVGQGKRSMAALLEAASPLLVAEDTWLSAAGEPGCLDDVDTPAQLARYAQRER
jgi:molybdopterin-guanine dinucleotide biosynthesis protein A